MVEVFKEGQLDTEQLIAGIEAAKRSLDTLQNMCDGRPWTELPCGSLNQIVGEHIADIAVKYARTLTCMEGNING